MSQLLPTLQFAALNKNRPDENWYESEPSNLILLRLTVCSASHRSLRTQMTQGIADALAVQIFTVALKAHNKNVFIQYTKITKSAVFYRIQLSFGVL